MILGNIKNQKTWTRLAIALFICSVFNFAARGQAPLDRASLSALIEELRGVVSKTAPDGKEAELVTARWDARKDLAGKTKSAVIDLLYADAKSVITDSGTLYQLYSMFSFYKSMPDSSFAGKASKSGTPLSKAAGVSKLVDLTYRMHPYVGIEEQLALLPGTKDVKEEEEKQRANRIEGFDAALKLNNKLTADQRSFVTANYDQLIKITDKITDDAIRTNFPTEKWIREGLKKSYTAKFTARELTTLVDNFQGTAGEQVLKYIRLTNMSQMITGNGGTIDLTDADKAEYDKFAGSPIGKKFIAAYMQEAIAYEQGRENAVRSRDPNADGFAIYRPENLNKLFNKFVAENYKK